MPQKELARTIYDDKVCRIILSKYPVEKGHLLVISKGHYKDMLSTPDPIVSHMFNTAKRFGSKSKRKLKCMGMDIGVNIGGAGTVPHLHIHVIPRYSNRRKPHFAPGKHVIKDSEVDEVRRLFYM
ncbi:MAG: HIT family protein [Candidatus Micrarchaeota archaeon]|nr:HIT family protein [Candidatus Micrarchaeota archaeon]